jgi:putative transcriptional regulator
MPIIVNLDVVLAQRKMRLNTLAELVDITPQNLSVLKSGRAKAIRFDTLEKICHVLQCQPGDILAFDGTLSETESVVDEPKLNK